MSAIVTGYDVRERPAPALVWRAPALAVPGWRSWVASCLVAACITVPEASLHAKWSRLTFVTGLALHRSMSPSR